MTSGVAMSHRWLFTFKIKYNQIFSSSVALATCHEYHGHTWVVAAVLDIGYRTFPVFQKILLDIIGLKLLANPWKGEDVLESRK